MGKNAKSNRQSRKSIHQISERMEDMWWNASEITPDTGEDVLVKVFEAPQGSASEGTPTGLTFLAQVKSIDAPGAHTDAVQIAYSLRTADLKDWEGHQPPVVLVIWDVSARIGYWLTVTDAIKRMEAGDAGWRAQKTVTAHVPLQNECNHAGLLRLRKLVADAVLPSSFSFQVPRRESFKRKRSTTRLIVEFNTRSTPNLSARSPTPIGSKGSTDSRCRSRLV